MTDLLKLPPPAPRRSQNRWDGEDLFGLIAGAILWVAILTLLIVGFLVPSTAWPWTYLLTL